MKIKKLNTMYCILSLLLLAGFVHSSENSDYWKRYQPIPLEVTDVSVGVTTNNLLVVLGTQPNRLSVVPGVLKLMVHSNKYKWKVVDEGPSCNGLKQTGQVVGHTMYVFGGQNCESLVQSYSTDTEEWSMLPQMGITCVGCMSAVIGNSVYVCGGQTPGRDGIFNTCGRYSTLTHQWENIAPMPVSVHGGATTVDSDDQLYIIGGAQRALDDSLDFDTEQNLVLRYDHKSDRWYTDDLPLPSPRYGTRTAIYYDRKIYLFGGGYTGSERRMGITRAGLYYRIDIYDMDRKMWLVGPNMLVTRTAIQPVRFRSKAIIIGGSRSAEKSRGLYRPSNLVHVFDVGDFSKIINAEVQGEYRRRSLLQLDDDVGFKGNSFELNNTLFDNQ